MATEESPEYGEFLSTVDDITKAMSNVRDVIQGLIKSPDLDTKDGISLLSLKHHLLLSYMQSLTLMMAHRVLGRSLKSRTRPSQPFTVPNREARGSEAGDLVDTLVEDRIILEKVKQLESKMRYQIEKLVRIAQEAPRAEVDVINDPLAFKPNPENLMDRAELGSDGESGEEANNHGIYRPPKLAPVPYTEKKDKSKKRAPVPAGLAALAELSGSKPLIESTSGLASGPSMASARARELARMTEFEEENMTRLVMTKTEARRRTRDEGDVALGGTGASKGRRRGGGLEDEFADILRTVDRSGDLEGTGDGYETLRVKGRKQNALLRSRTRPRDESEDDRVRKKSRFETAVKSMARKRKRH